MKTISKTIFTASLALAFILTSFTATASTHSEKKNIFDPKKMSSGLTFDLDNLMNPLKFRLDIRQPENHLVNVTIYDKDGKQVYSEFTSKKEMSQLFNVSNLGYGEYTVEIATLGEVASDKIILEKPDHLKPMAFIKKSEKIKNKVTIVSLNTESTVSVIIKDQNNKVVYKDNYYKKDHREFLNLNWLPEGEYSVTMRSDNFSETEKIMIN